jgi:glycyl-tRNA synthetase beta chain
VDRELLLEIGVEELPASWLPSLTAQLAARLTARLVEDGLPCRTTAEAHGTPRRLAVCQPELIDRQEDRDETVMGPPVSAAFDAEGHPTNAGLGFARKLGVDFDAIERTRICLTSATSAGRRRSTCCRASSPRSCAICSSRRR